ncbi:CPBP family intramembrane glutamic endopeptidase [Gelidibacter japonicus]|uniref:CPBP family intramembrane glutamic endopeptidase n=1 Tax=Gelidibacter japonicus TaxID=1962232 RepID=UPI0013D76FB2|nr:CPBP family intramembrane glutamic endopeptidase [Gelidibacter japonicus]
MKAKPLLIIFIGFTIYFIVDDLYFKFLRDLLNENIHNFGISHIISYLIFGLPLFIGALIIDTTQSFFEKLGLNASIVKGVIFSLICTAPMFIGFAFLFSFNHDLSLNEFLVSGIAAAFFEELYFRGFLFGLAFKYSRLGFFWSVISGAILFAAIHSYQSQEIETLIGIFLTTFLGAVIFAWVYVEWNFNLWTAIGVHFFMNVSWMLFSVSDNALGDVYANIFRIITIILIFGLTIIYKKRKNIPLIITKKTIWMLKEPVIKGLEAIQVKTANKTTRHK